MKISDQIHEELMNNVDKLRKRGVEIGFWTKMGLCQAHKPDFYLVLEENLLVSSAALDGDMDADKDKVADFLIDYHQWKADGSFKPDLWIEIGNYKWISNNDGTVDLAVFKDGVEIAYHECVPVDELNDEVMSSYMAHS